MVRNVVFVTGIITLLGSLGFESFRRATGGAAETYGTACYNYPNSDCSYGGNRFCTNLGPGATGADCAQCDGVALLNGTFCAHTLSDTHCLWPEQPQSVNCGDKYAGTCRVVVGGPGGLFSCDATPLLLLAGGCGTIPIGCIGTASN